MKQQMTLEEYKKKVIELLITKHNYTTEEAKEFLINPEELWLQLMKDFSPEIAAQYLNSGL
jgi:hypothetical protein